MLLKLLVTCPISSFNLDFISTVKSPSATNFASLDNLTKGLDILFISINNIIANTSITTKVIAIVKLLISIILACISFSLYTAPTFQLKFGIV